MVYVSAVFCIKISVEITADEVEEEPDVLISEPSLIELKLIGSEVFAAASGNISAKRRKWLFPLLSVIDVGILKSLVKLVASESNPLSEYNFKFSSVLMGIKLLKFN